MTGSSAAGPGMDDTGVDDIGLLLAIAFHSHYR